jgi:ArsR family metal-binding transcriptional regulator
MKVTIEFEARDEDEAAEELHRVAEQIREGFTSGHVAPGHHWEMTEAISTRTDSELPEETWIT